jgi:hypothetical protein
MGPLGAVLQRRPGVSGHGLPIRRLGSAEPLVDRLARDAHDAGDLCDGGARLDAPDYRGSQGVNRANLWVFMRALMVVRRGLDNLSLQPLSPVNNLLVLCS